ncbi:MAG: HPr family phosphocarrier protein [Pseudomonadales bacterium]|nr:HPr family phosphocarrier protein [Pseudomonadales bacterium]
MINTKITITNKAGLHARAAAKFVSTVSEFVSNVEIGSSLKMVDGKSILSIMLLAAAQGSELELIINGPDETQALQAILNLVDNRFGEE